jgi:tetratricopeptide (TPR) repeat protein
MTSRRTFLMSAAAGAIATSVLADDIDADELFRSGRFAAADWAYKRILRDDPENIHALERRGTIALLSNKLAPAEKFLQQAVGLAPDRNDLKSSLADCYVRRDDLARAAPLIRAAGDAATADQYASVTGRAYEVHGAMSARLPFRFIDPLPVIEASVNGNPASFILDTGATFAINAEMAERAGIREVASTTVDAGNGQLIIMHLGVVDSLAFGDMELRNVPVFWSNRQLPQFPGAEEQPIGAIGTTIFYRFLSTMDYANQALILRRKRAECHSAFTAPLWLAPDHYIFSMGRVNDLGPGVFSVDTGGPGFGIGLRDEMAARAGIVPDYTQPKRFFGVTVYPCVADEIAVGRSIRHDVPGIVGPLPSREDKFGFETIGTVTHEFFRPLAVTFDFTKMALCLTGDSLAGK